MLSGLEEIMCLLPVSVLAEVQSAVDKLTRLSGKVDRNMLMWKEEQGVGLGR